MLSPETVLYNPYLTVVTHTLCNAWNTSRRGGSATLNRYALGPNGRITTRNSCSQHFEHTRVAQGPLCRYACYGHLGGIVHTVEIPGHLPSRVSPARVPP